MLKKYIDNKIIKETSRQFREVGATRKVQSQSPTSGLAKVISIQDGKYLVELPDKTTKEINPIGRAVGPGGHILFSGDYQIY